MYPSILQSSWKIKMVALARAGMNVAGLVWKNAFPDAQLMKIYGVIDQSGCHYGIMPKYGRIGGYWCKCFTTVAPRNRSILADVVSMQASSILRRLSHPLVDGSLQK